MLDNGMLATAVGIVAVMAITITTTDILILIILIVVFILIILITRISVIVHTVHTINIFAIQQTSLVKVYKTSRIYFSRHAFYQCHHFIVKAIIIS